MKKIIPAFIMLLLATSCTTQKQVVYFQDLLHEGSVNISAPQDIRLKVGDQVTIHVNSKDQELTLPLNLTRTTNNGGGQGECPRKETFAVAVLRLSSDLGVHLG